MFAIYKEEKWCSAVPFVDKQNLNDIINRIKQDKKLQHQFRSSQTAEATEQTEDKLYTDEPILMTADKIKNYTPRMYKELKQIIADAKRGHMDKQQAFYEQARFMEHFEDDYKANYLYTTDFIFFPTYDQFNTMQLRQYFTWRKEFRQGKRDFAPRAFIFLYIYELLHNIGVKDAYEGLQKLLEIDDVYKDSETHTSFYLTTWIRDYIIYHNLPKELGKKYFNETFDEAYTMFVECQKRSDAEVVQALTELAGFNIMASKTYKKHAEAVTQIAANVIRDVATYYETHGKYTMGQKYFGVGGTELFPLFDRAVFYDYKHYAEYRYAISDIQAYTYINNCWRRECAYSTIAKSVDLGNLLRTLENELRVHFGIVPLLKEVKTLKTFKKFIAQEIEAYAERKRQEARQKAVEEARAKQPKLDLSKLAGIRAAAEGTRDRLLTEEERGTSVAAEDTNLAMMSTISRTKEKVNIEMQKQSHEIVGGVIVTSLFDDEGNITSYGSGSDASSKATKTAVEDISPAFDYDNIVRPEVQSTPIGLTAQEQHFMELVLQGEDAAGYARSERLMLSVLIDSINEKFYEEIGDCVLDFDGMKPILIEDYEEDVKELLHI